MSIFKNQVGAGTGVALLSNDNISTFSANNKRSSNKASVSQIFITNNSKGAGTVTIYLVEKTGSITLTGGGYAASSDATITHDTNNSIAPGMTVTSSLPGVPGGSTVHSVTDSTHFELSANTTDAQTAAVLTLGVKYYIVHKLLLNANDTISLLDTPMSFNVSTHTLMFDNTGTLAHLTIIVN